MRLFTSTVKESGKRGRLAGVTSSLLFPSLQPYLCSIWSEKDGLHCPQGKIPKDTAIICFARWKSGSDHYTSNCPQPFSRDVRLMCLFVWTLWQLCNLLYTPHPQCIWNLLSSIPSARFLLTGKYRGSIIFITKACGSPLGASNSWRDDQGGKRLNYIHCYFNINILWFFAQACMVYLTILLTKVSQMERAELDMLGTLFTVRRQWKEDSWHFTGWEQLFCKAFTGLGFEKH